MTSPDNPENGTTPKDLTPAPEQPDPPKELTPEPTESYLQTLFPPDALKDMPPEARRVIEQSISLSMMRMGPSSPMAEKTKSVQVTMTSPPSNPAPGTMLSITGCAIFFATSADSDFLTTPRVYYDATDRLSIKRDSAKCFRRRTNAQGLPMTTRLACQRYDRLLRAFVEDTNWPLQGMASTPDARLRYRE